MQGGKTVANAKQGNNGSGTGEVDEVAASLGIEPRTTGTPNKQALLQAAIDNDPDLYEKLVHAKQVYGIEGLAKIAAHYVDAFESIGPDTASKALRGYIPKADR